MKKLSENVGLIEKFLVLAEKYKFSTVLKSIAIIFMFSVTISFIANPMIIFDRYEEIKDKRHRVQMEQVNRNNAIIQSELENLIYRTGANRVLLLQYHNTKNSLSGIPFIYLTATSEALTYGIAPVSEGYEALKTSLYPFVNYISKAKYFCGDISDLEKEDKALAYRMRGNDVHHLAICHIDGEVPLGILVLTYTDELSQTHNCKYVEQEIRNASIRIGCLISNTKF